VQHFIAEDALLALTGGVGWLVALPGSSIVEYNTGKNRVESILEIY